MARHKEFNFRTPLVKMFSAKMIRSAKQTGAVIRERKICIVDFLWTLILGFGAGKERSISGMRRMYIQCSGKKVEESSFYNRFNAGLVKLLKQLTAQFIDELCGAGRALQGQLSAFSDLILTDSTIMQLHELKSFSDLEIIANNQICRGRSIDLVGQNVQTVADSLKRESFDVMVQADVRKRKYAGKTRKNVQQFRVVGVWDQHDKRYHIFITNVPVEMLSAKQIAQTYAARWEIELLFKELKNNYRMDNLPSKKKHVVEALVYAAILTLIVSRKILQQLRIQKNIPQERLPKLRWAALLESVATWLLFVMIRPPSETGGLARLITSMLIHEAPDPNKSRTGLLNAVEMGTHQYERRDR